MRRKFVVGNWKSNGSRASNRVLVKGLREASFPDIDVAVCAPFVYLADLAAELAHSSVAVGAQDVSEFGCGAYTGEICVEMLRDVGCRLVIVGHSERRTLLNEDDDRIARKVARVLDSEVQAVLCVGETLSERESGNTSSVILRQLDAVAKIAGREAFPRTVIAYEPVWAIGTGISATPEQAQEVHALIRLWLRSIVGQGAVESRILYGGSVKLENAAQLFDCPDIDGALVGGASLRAIDFLGICHAAGPSSD